MEGESTVSAEYKIISRMGIPFVSLTAGRLQRKFTRYTISSLFKIPIGFFQALWWVGKFRSDVILSFGGYVALPVVLAGWLWRVPVITHEQTVISGLANKIIAFFAQKICVSWPDSLDRFPKDKVVLIGNPIRKEIFAKVQSSSSSWRIKVQSDNPVVYITGGNLGSHWINEAVFECLSRLLEKYTVIHQCGDSEKYQDYGKLKAQSETLRLHSGYKLQERYFLTKYVEPEDIGWVLDKADLVVSRSGANTVTELAALGKPALLIPIPWVHANEQYKNAQLLADIGTAEILPQEKLSGEELERQIGKMVQNLKSYQEKSEQAKKLVNLKAAEKIAGIVYEIYTQKRENTN